MRMRGAGIGRGTAIGAAAVVRMMSGIPLPPEMPPRIAKERAIGRNSELPDVIIVAEELRIALAVSGAISWANVVGIAAVRPEAASSSAPFPAVVGLADLLEAVEDDMLLLLDASSGILLADPDPVAIAQYQAEAEHLAPKRRFFLEDVHLPAQTQDGRPLLVVARVENPAEIASAIESGADALYVPLSSASFTEDDEAAQRAHKLAILEAIGGKPIFVEYAPDDPLAPVLEAAAKSDYTLVQTVLAETENGGLAALSVALHENYEDMQDSSVVALPTLAAAFIVNEAPELDYLFESGAKYLITRYPLFSVSPTEDLINLTDISAGAAMRSAPHLFNLSSLTTDAENFNSRLREVVGSGITGLLVSFESVAKIKAAIRDLNYAECRAEVERLISEGKSA